MLISYNWLNKEYFSNKLPKPEKLAELLTFHVFEIESMEKVGDDTVLDVKVLPDRACYALSHKGIAYEILAITGLSQNSYEPVSYDISYDVKKPEIEIEDNKLCRRYVGRRVEGLKIGESPAWLKERLNSIGQKSINNIVDATNFVMYDMGQPLHAFDADKVVGKLYVRLAKDGETMTTLDNREIKFTPDVLVIADEKGPLAVAGIKGGKRAEVDNKTRNIIIESANFNPSLIRKGSQTVNIKTDGSKRHESNLSLALPELGMSAITETIVKLCPEAKVSEVTDSYSRSLNKYKIGTTIENINKRLGIEIGEKEIVSILNKLNISISKIVPEKVILDEVNKLIGRPYKYGASVSLDAPDSFDCSSLTSFIYVQAGFQIPRISVEQFIFGESIEEKDIKLGDLVFMKGAHPYFYDETPEGVGHVGMYLGDNKVIEASSPIHAGKVIVSELLKWTKSPEFRGIKRISQDLKTERLIATVPYERMDLRIKEDLVEEVGRIYGYEKIKSVLPPKPDGDPKILKELYYSEKIKDRLIDLGFSEVFNSSFSNKGDIEIEKSLASDKNFVRTNLSEHMNTALRLNTNNAELIGIKDVKIFEIGKVFDKTGEHTALVIGIKKMKKEKGITAESILDEAVGQVERVVGRLNGKAKQTELGLIYEVRIGEAIGKLSEPISWDLEEIKDTKVKYQRVSSYPFIVRDLALFVGVGDDEGDVLKVIIDTAKQAAGELLIKGPWCFDRFEKDGKKSFAFRMIFQSFERTLTDEEVNGFMELIYSAVKKSGWEVR